MRLTKIHYAKAAADLGSPEPHRLFLLTQPIGAVSVGIAW